jgi:hypothetical protein
MARSNAATSTSFVTNGRGSRSSDAAHVRAHSLSSILPDRDHNDAVVLAEVLRRGLPED